MATTFSYGAAICPTSVELSAISAPGIDAGATAARASVTALPTIARMAAANARTRTGRNWDNGMFAPYEGACEQQEYQ
ncbi:MAG TPA: hypothetical protein VNO21_13475, partial [Polyangiaceae bacterium]|nr:hypothetical protein [Polyangiaceae bacterium]